MLGIEIIKMASLIFVAELGDKSFFIALVLAGRKEASKIAVFVGCVAALILNAVIASFIGYGLSQLLHTHAAFLEFLTAGVFFAFGIKMVYDWHQSESSDCGGLAEAMEAVEGNNISQTSILFAAFIMNFVGEIGDKTQLAVIAEAGHAPDLKDVMLGASLGFIAVTGLACTFGALVAKHLTDRRVLGCGSILFILFGCASLVDGFSKMA